MQGQMFNPVFFIGTSYAIHGSASVPLQPVLTLTRGRPPLNPSICPQPS